LSEEKNIANQISALQHAAGDDEANIERRLDELITLLTKANIDSGKVKLYQKKFNEAIDNSSLKAFEQLDNNSMSREELLNNLGRLLEEHPVNSNITGNIAKKSTTKRIVLALIGLTMITLGFAMIIMPAPPYFEMFTVFYFSNDDGVTIMDLISLVVVLCGVYLLVVSIIKHKRGI